MANKTAIQWTDLSWNPVHGCSKVSPGCAHCYAETLSLRYKQTLKPWTPENAAENVILKPHKLREPLSQSKQWREPKMVFVNSMSDLFHELVPDDYIAEVFGVMANADQHIFQVLTKRPERMRELLSDDDWWHDVRHYAANAARDTQFPDCAYLTSTQLDAIESSRRLANCWLGVSIENRRYVARADALRQTPAAVRFISAEPLLGPLIFDGYVKAGVETEKPLMARSWSDGFMGPELDLTGIDWLIVGGESGSGFRRMKSPWVRDLRDAAQEVGVAFFFKQIGGLTPKAGGRTLDGRTWDEMPVRHG